MHLPQTLRAGALDHRVPFPAHQGRPHQIARWETFENFVRDVHVVQHPENFRVVVVVVVVVFAVVVVIVVARYSNIGLS